MFDRSGIATAQAYAASTAALRRAEALRTRPLELAERGIRPPHLFSSVARLRQPSALTRSLERSNRLQEIFERMDELDQELEQANPLARYLAHLLDHASFGLAMVLTERLIDDGPQVMIDLLADILLSEQALDLFEAAAREGDIRVSVRSDLLHALDHLRESDFMSAGPSLVIGVEGAIRDTVPVGERRPANARGAAEKAIPEHKFRVLFGKVFTEVNALRHGEEADRRAACVLLLAALLIWIEASFEASTMKWLGGHLDREIRRSKVLQAA